jgi:hypothetical protein
MSSQLSISQRSLWVSNFASRLAWRRFFKCSTSYLRQLKRVHHLWHKVVGVGWWGEGVIVLVDVIRWRRVGPWRLRIVWRLARLPCLASNFGHLTAIFRPGKRICCLGEYGYIAAFASGLRSTSDIEKGSALRSLLLAHMHTGLSLKRWSDIGIKSGHASPKLEPAHLLLSAIIDHTAVECAFLAVLNLLVSCVFLHSLAGHCP